MEGEVCEEPSQREEVDGDGSRGGRQWHVVKGSKRCGMLYHVLLSYSLCVLSLQDATPKKFCKYIIYK